MREVHIRLYTYVYVTYRVDGCNAQLCKLRDGREKQMRKVSLGYTLAKLQRAKKTKSEGGEERKRVVGGGQAGGRATRMKERGIYKFACRKRVGKSREGEGKT